MRTILLLTLFVSLSGVLPGFAQDTQQLDDINYSFGHFLGKDLQRNAVQLRIDRLLDGLFDASEQLDPQYSQDEMQALRGVKHAKEEEILEKINYAYGYKNRPADCCGQSRNQRRTAPVRSHRCHRPQKGPVQRQGDDRVAGSTEKGSAMRAHRLLAGLLICTFFAAARPRKRRGAAGHQRSAG